jgi:hypothetical protein
VQRTLAFDEHVCAQGQHARRIVRKPAGERLPGEMGDAAERIADPDVPHAIDRRTRHQRKNLSGA